MTLHPSPPCASPVLFRLPLLDPLVRLRDTLSPPRDNAIASARNESSRTDRDIATERAKQNVVVEVEGSWWLATRATETRIRKEEHGSAV